MGARLLGLQRREGEHYLLMDEQTAWGGRYALKGEAEIANVRWGISKPLPSPHGYPEALGGSFRKATHTSSS